MAPYLTPEQAQARLSEYGITVRTAEESGAATLLTAGDLKLASNELDSKALAGRPYLVNQERQFPRSVTLPGDTEAEVPDAVLDWVALRAYQLSKNEGPGVTSEGAGGVNVSYARPKLSQTEQRMRQLLAPYKGRIYVT